MVTIFSPSFADANNTNAQNLTVKAIVPRFDPERFHVSLVCVGEPDALVAARPNTNLIRYYKHGNTPNLLAYLIENPPDIYFFPREGPLDTIFLELQRRGMFRSRIITYIVSGGLLTMAQPYTRKRAVLQAHRLFGNNRRMVGEIQQRFGRTPHGTIYDGVEERWFHPDANRQFPVLESGKLRVLYAGSFRDYKRVDVFVKQAADWPQVEFRIAGSGLHDEEPKLRALVAQLGCRNVTFLGHISPGALGDEMRAAHVFLFPSELEGNPQVVAQAAACGMPIIAMGCYDPDYVVGGETALLANSHEELPGLLRRLFENPDLRRSLSLATAKFARQFSWDSVARQWERVFDDVMAEAARD